MKKLLIFFLLGTGAATAQRIPDYGFNKIRIVADEKVIQAELLPIKSAPEPETNKLYYWSSSNAIRTTQGGFSGKLLNGSYTEYYPNKNLKEQGQFDRGLKTGIWKSWTESGAIVQFYTWKDGVLSGKFELYDANGHLKQTGSYHKSQLDGKVTNYLPSGKTETLIYKNGELKDTKPSKLWSKFNVFKKLKKDSVQRISANPDVP